jgi:hypothetical protein
MDYTKPPKCLEVLDCRHGALCPMLHDKVHVCTEDVDHKAPHRCACGVVWGLDLGVPR